MAIPFLVKTIFKDNVKLVFGDGEDLQIYHDASNSYIKDVGTGDLILSAHNFIIKNPVNTETIAEFNKDSDVKLYFNNTVKLKTVTTGIDVTGTVNLDNLTINAAQGTDGQVLTSTGTGIAWEDATSETAERIEVTVKNVSGGSLSKGAVVHASPTANPPNGNVIEVIAADYDDSTKMPAIGILNETIANEGEGAAVMMGAVSGIDTSGFSIGDELYVGNLGAFTNSKPAAAGQLIQKIAVVIKSHASNGLIKIFGAGRSNDVPLPLYIDNTNQRVGISTSSPAEKLDITNGKLRFTNTTSSRNSTIGMDDNYNFFIKNTSAGNLYIGNSTTTFVTGNLSVDNGVFYVDASNDRVGIGTSSPISKFQLISAGFPQVRINDETTGGESGIRFRSKGTGVDLHGDIFIDGTGSETGRMGFRIPWNGTEKMTILSSGDVGIGTTSPSNGKLQIDSASNQISIETVTSGDGRLHIGHFSNGTFIGTYGDDGGAADLIRFGTHSGDERLRIGSAGQIGIGGANYGTSGQVLTSNGSGSAPSWQNAGAGSSNWTLSGNDIYNNNSGNVGIGTTSPLSKLHVAGNIQVNNPSGAGNGSPNETARIVNTTSGATSSYMYIGASSGNDWRVGKNILGTSGGSNFGIALHAGSTLALEIDGSSNVISNVSSRAPIFYDSNNTGYYVDPNSTSNLNALTVNGVLTVNNKATIDYLELKDQNGTVESNFHIYGWDTELQFTKRNLSTGAWEGTLLALDYSTTNATFAGQIATTQNQITTNIGTTSAIRLKPGSTTNTTGKSSIFLGTSSVDNYGISLRGARLGSDGTPTFELATHFNSANGTVALSINNSQNATFAGSVETEGPDGGLVLRTWTGNSSYGMLGTSNMSGSEYSLLTDGTHTYISGGVSGNVYIRAGNNDSNNQLEINSSKARFYGDVQSDDQFINNGNGFKSLNFRGMVGDYDTNGTATKIIWTIGDSWNSTGSMYGLAYEYNGTYGHHLALKENGTTYQRLSFYSGSFFSGTVTSNTDFRAPIFYDSNDTGYYVDPASQSNLNSLSMTGRFEPDDPDGYVSSTITGLTNAPIYYPESNVGTSNVYVPHTHSRTRYSGGYRAHISTGVHALASAWNYRYYIAQGGNDSYPTKALEFDVYNNNIYHSDGWVRIDGSTRSPIFYDSNNTGYYTNPASTSNLNDLTINRYFSGKGGTKVFDLYDTYLRFNQGREFSNGIWVGSSHIKQGTAYIAAGSNGGTTSSRVYIYGGNYTGANIIKIDGSTGIIQTSADSMRAPLFYDYNNTNYYANPYGTSVFKNLVLRNDSAQGYYDSTIEFRNNSNTLGSHIEYNAVPGFTGYKIYISASGASTSNVQYELEDRELTFQSGTFHLKNNIANAVTHSLTGTNLLLTPALKVYQRSSNISYTMYDLVTFHATSSASQVGSIRVNAYGTQFATSSDYRLKENEIPIADGIQRVKQLQPKRFNFIGYSEQSVDGFMAHEVMDIVPESVGGVKDEVDDEGNPLYQSIDQSKLVPLLTAALKEAITKIEDLETRIQTLENQ